MLKPAEMFQIIPSTKKRVMLPSCHFGIHPQSAWKPRPWVFILAGVQDPTSQLWQDPPWMTPSCSTPTNKFSLCFGKGKLIPKGRGSCGQGDANWWYCVILWSSVLLLPGALFYLSLLLTLAVSPFSFVFSWGFCVSSVSNKQCQDFNWSSFCWQDDPFAQKNSSARSHISLFFFLLSIWTSSQQRDDPNKNIYA